MLDLTKRESPRPPTDQKPERRHTTTNRPLSLVNQWDLPTFLRLSWYFHQRYLTVVGKIYYFVKRRGSNRELDDTT